MHSNVRKNTLVEGQCKEMAHQRNPKPIEICITGWWLTYPSEKYESQLGVLCPIYGKIKAMFQTTNQIISVGKPGLGSPKSDEFNSTTLLLLFLPSVLTALRWN